MKFRELERLVLEDGWQLKGCIGSHYQYAHPEKKGKVTIPYHSGDVAKAVIHSVLRQAGLK